MIKRKKHERENQHKEPSLRSAHVYFLLPSQTQKVVKKNEGKKTKKKMQQIQMECRWPACGIMM